MLQAVQQTGHFRLILSLIHIFAQHIYKKTNQDTYTWTDAKDLVDVVNQSYKKFKNIPIILGEYGTKNRKYTSNPSGFNDIGRAYYFECATRAGQVGNTVPCVWDQGCNTSDIYETGTYIIWNRNENKPLFCLLYTSRCV